MGLPEKYHAAFTLVFEGDMRKFAKNPFTTDTPYGLPYTVALGDVCQERDELEEKLKQYEAER